jgi:hypothetical protein
MGFSSVIFFEAGPMAKVRDKGLAARLAVADSGRSPCSRETCPIGAVAIGTLATIVEWCEFQISTVGGLMDALAKEVPDVLGLKAGGKFPHGGGDVKGGRRCRVCGCTDAAPCVVGGESCWWVGKELCSVCAAKEGKVKVGAVPRGLRGDAAAVGGRRGGRSPAAGRQAAAKGGVA